MSISKEDSKSLSRGRRKRALADGSLLHFKARRFPDAKKVASKNACRGKVSE